MELSFTYPTPLKGIIRAVGREKIPEDAVWDASNVVHVTNRVRKVPGYEKIGATLASRVQRLAVQYMLNGDVASWALTQTRIYEDVSGTWTNRTHAAPGDYTSGARWILDQVSNQDIMLATNNKEQVQKCVPGTACVDLAGSPPFTKCFGVRQFRDFMLYWGTTEGGDYKETRVRWSDVGLFETYSGGLAGFADLSGSDPIFDIQPLTDDTAVVYRERSIWRMRFVGAPLVFFFEEVVAKGSSVAVSGFGVCSPFSVSVSSGFHEYIGPTGLFSISGQVPTPYGEFGRLLLFAELNQGKRDVLMTHLDEFNQLKFHFFPTANASDYPDKALIESYKAIHGEARAFWFRTDIAPTGIGYWIESSLDTWNASSDTWNTITGAWTSAATLPDQALRAFGDNAGNVYKLSFDTPDGNGAAIPMSYESGLILIADKLLESNPRAVNAGFREGGKSICTRMDVEFDLRGAQNYFVDIGHTEGPGETITWVQHTVPLTAISGHAFKDVWISGRYFAYRVRTTGVGIGPICGDIILRFVPDSELD